MLDKHRVKHHESVIRYKVRYIKILVNKAVDFDREINYNFYDVNFQFI